MNYEEAATLLRRLRGDKIYGLCIVSDEAARRYDANNNGATAPNIESESAPPPAKKRAPRRKSTKLS